MGEIVEEARQEFGAQRIQLQNLYERTAVELAALEERMEKAEAAAQGQGKGRLIQARQMVPRVLTKQEEWKVWKSEVEDYCEVVRCVSLLTPCLVLCFSFSCVLCLLFSCSRRHNGAQARWRVKRLFKRAVITNCHLQARRLSTLHAPNVSQQWILKRVWK